MTVKSGMFVYYETIKREVKIKPISECRCDERLKTKSEEFTPLSDTGFLGELEHPKIYYESIKREQETCTCPTSGTP